MSFINGYKAVLLEVLNASKIEHSHEVVNNLAAARSYIKQEPHALAQAIEKVK